MKKEQTSSFLHNLSNVVTKEVKTPEEFVRYIYDYLNESDLKEIAQSVPATDKSPQTESINALSEYYRNGTLVLVLGAGVSLDHGLPDWNTLLQKLLLSTIAKDTKQPKDKAGILAKIYTALFSPTPLIAARYLNYFYRKTDQGDGLSFEKAIREAIYEEIREAKDSALLKEIRKFCIAAGKSPNLDSIITYNYDDLIESYLRNIDVDVPFKSIYAPGMNAGRDELPIHHVHGFLPQNGELSERNRVTLSEELYHQQYSDIYGWSNLVQINKFKDINCVFIGISFSDPNLRRLLDIARIQRGDTEVHHYHFRKRHDAKQIEAQIKTFLDQHPDVLDEKDKASLRLSEVVKYLVQIIEGFEENDARSFGVGTIWIKDYSEIAKLLAKVRKAHKG